MAISQYSESSHLSYVTGSKETVICRYMPGGKINTLNFSHLYIENSIGVSECYF